MQQEQHSKEPLRVQGNCLPMRYEARMNIRISDARLRSGISNRNSKPKVNEYGVQIQNRSR